MLLWVTKHHHHIRPFPPRISSRVSTSTFQPIQLGQLALVSYEITRCLFGHWKTLHCSRMTTPQGQPPSVAAQLEAPASEPTLAPSTHSRASFEKEARSLVSSRGKPVSSSGNSRSSIVKDETAEEDVELADVLAKVQTARTQNGSALHPTETREDGTEYPSGTKLILISVALCLSVFLTALE